MRTRAAILRAWEWWVRWIYAPILGVVAAIVVRIATRRGADVSPLLERLGRRALRPSCCCPDAEPDAVLARRFAAVVTAVGDRRHLRALLAPPRLAHTRRWMTAAARVILLQELRHGLLSWLRDKTGRPVATLSEVQIAVAPDCTLTCAGCYARPSHGGPEPTRASILRVVDQAAALGATAVHVIGKGEPLAPRARGLAVASAIAARPHLVFTVATSGAGIDDAVLERLSAAANALVLVSIDGPEDAHDARRGEGSFAEARALMARLRDRGIAFGFSTMVSRGGLPAILDPEHLADLAALGCLAGVFVRYFPLAPDRADALLMRPSDVAAFRAELDRVRPIAPLPLIDLDELEEETGCRARLGKSLYLDAVRGEVAPCLRVPFAPAGVARLGEAPLEAILAAPFFEAYRARASTRCHSCGVDLARELGDVEADLASCASPSLAAYRARAGRSLPLLSPSSTEGASRP